MRLIFLSVAGLLALAAALESVHGGEAQTGDEQLLRSAKVEPSGEGLLEFFRKRSLTDDEIRNLQSWIERLGSEAYQSRAEASSHILVLGLPALPSLRRAAQNPDLEIARRAEVCLQEIERRRDVEPALVSAAARLLALRKPVGAVQALLLYLPFNDEDGVEEEVLAALRTLSEQAGNVAADLVPLLQDPLSARRGAAAYVLGRLADPGHQAQARALLTDADPKVRLRAAQGLAAGRDKSAVPTLVALLGDAPPTLTWKVEELLQRLAGDQAPAISAGDGSSLARQKYRDAWTGWWQAHAAEVDLGRLEQDPPQRGFTLIAEMDSDRVWESGSDGKPRWKVEHLQCPMDAQILPSSHVLIAEYKGKCVTERDLLGNILWRKDIDGAPVACQRLPDGNTFIVTHDSFLEVARDGKEVYLRRPAPGLFVFGARKLASGNIAYVANPGMLQEFDPIGNKTIRSIRLGNNFGGWASVEALPGGRFLIAIMASGKVVELDGAGNTIWQCQVPSASHATRLPNGHTLVASLGSRRLVEVDRDGRTIKETSTEGRPWRVRQR